MSLFVSFLITIILIWYVLSPVIAETSPEELSDRNDSSQRFLDIKERGFQALRDLELDFNTGKVLEVDYNVMKDQIIHEIAVAEANFDTSSLKAAKTVQPEN